MNKEPNHRSAAEAMERKRLVNVNKLIREFRISISNVLLYPKESELISSSIDDAYNIIIDILKGEESFTVSETEGKLLVNAEPLGEEDSGGLFKDRLDECNIKSVTFKPCISNEALRLFLEGLALKKDVSEISAGLGENEPKQSIILNERVYISVSEEEKIGAPGKGKNIAFSAEEITDTFNTIISAYQIISQTGTPGRGKQGIDSLRDSIEKTVSLVSAKDPPLGAKLKKQLDSLKLIPEVSKPIPTMSLKEQAENLTKLSSKALLNEDVLKQIPDLLQRLKSPAELKLAGNLCDKLADNLEASIRDTRLKAVVSFHKFYSVIEALRDRNIVKNLDNKFIETEKKEQDDEIYAEISTLLQKAAGRYLRNGEYKKTHEIVELFKNHSEQKKFIKRRERAKETINKLVGSEMSRLLIDDLCASNIAKRNKAVSILIELGDSVVMPLIQEIEQTGDLRLRHAIVSILKKIGEDAVSRLLGELSIDKATDPVLRIISVLETFEQPELCVKKLTLLLSHPDFRVRRACIHLLNKIDIESAKLALIGALDDTSITIRTKVIEFLGKPKYSLAVPKLIGLITPKGVFSSEEPEAIQEQVCRALGNIGNKDAINPLEQVASSSTPFSRFIGTKSTKIRVSAIQSLYKLGYDVRKFSLDKDPLVRRTAEQLCSHTE